MEEWSWHDKQGHVQANRFQDNRGGISQVSEWDLFKASKYSVRTSRKSLEIIITQPNRTEIGTHHSRIRFRTFPE
jgi:hypothetical protein